MAYPTFRMVVVEIVVRPRMSYTFDVTAEVEEAMQRSPIPLVQLSYVLVISIPA